MRKKDIPLTPLEIAILNYIEKEEERRKRRERERREERRRRLYLPREEPYYPYGSRYGVY